MILLEQEGLRLPYTEEGNLCGCRQQRDDDGRVSPGGEEELTEVMHAKQKIQACRKRISGDVGG